MNIFKRFYNWLLVLDDPKPATPVGPNNPPNKPKPKVIDIKVWVNLENSLYTIQQFACDGYRIPNIDRPYEATNYLDKWLIARHIGDGYNIKPCEFLEACLDTKTSSSMMYCGYEIKVTIMNSPQTYTNTKPNQPRPVSKFD